MTSPLRTESSPQGRQSDREPLTGYDDASPHALDTLPGPQESPVSIVFNDTAYATVLATPHQLEALAVGFAFSEGVIDRYADVEATAVETSRHGFRVRLQVAERIARRAGSQARATLSTSGCGACGVQEESQLLFGLTRLPVSSLPLVESLGVGLDALRTESSPGVHLALGLSEQGRIDTVGRDIGRHNALDKVIGASLMTGRMPALVMTSSRCSLELVQKSVRARIPALATLSYPSRLAVEVARSCNLTLINCHRGKRLELLSRGDG
ncbi:formate dehydrogenase accessory sulfurtransferase FdhD [Salinicola acroporae]|uniref:Sulfurtransferase FdhD n=1 Tax=Salinicola acroporae TaxID=1541440 RepID=A0ABT6I9X9_9GAMM|nr:formate dehydrogenase accessory sulfurtransferase FdhD [Salinicola acroporae]MDH4574507.1 sulfurtransferase FdhD [Salinicola acroporae]